MSAFEESVSEELSNRIKRDAYKRSLSAGETLFALGERPEFLPIIESGRIKIFRFLTPGKEIIVNVFGQGDIFAIPPVLEGTSYPANAAALVESELLLLPRKRFLELLDESKEFSSFIMSRMSLLLGETTRSMMILANASPEERIAQVLLWLASKENRSLPVSISLRRQDIAEIAGLTTETTIRTIRNMAASGIVTIERGKVLIEEMALLESVGQE